MRFGIHAFFEKRDRVQADIPAVAAYKRKRGKTFGPWLIGVHFWNENDRHVGLCPFCLPAGGTAWKSVSLGDLTETYEIVSHTA